MKAKYQFYVTDWAPNGTNDLIVRDCRGRQVDYKPEALFGVNVSNLGPARCFDSHFYCPEYKISSDLVKRHVADSPIEGTHEDNCTFIKKYLISTRKETVGL